MTDRLVVKLKEKENVLHCVYLNDFNMVMAAFVLQCNEAKNWYDGINKARHIYIKLKQDVDVHSIKIVPQHQQQQQHHIVNNNYSIADSISIKKSPLGSSIGE
jgi:pleckstrin homology domain-containing family G member 5